MNKEKAPQHITQGGIPRVPDVAARAGGHQHAVGRCTQSHREATPQMSHGPGPQPNPELHAGSCDGPLERADGGEEDPTKERPNAAPHALLCTSILHDDHMAALDKQGQQG